MAIFTFVLFAVLCIDEVKSYQATKCERKYVAQCTDDFKNVWKSSGKNELLRDVYCRAYEVSAMYTGSDINSFGLVALSLWSVNLVVLQYVALNQSEGFFGGKLNAFQTNRVSAKNSTSS